MFRNGERTTKIFRTSKTNGTSFGYFKNIFAAVLKVLFEEAKDFGYYSNVKSGYTVSK